jgi:citrate lyase subunit beta / citryl-CoA lyase
MNEGTANSANSTDFDCSLRPRRSALYMPATNAKAIARARTLAADIIILDLEDSVAPEMKAEARACALAAVFEGGFGNREVVIRVNGLDTAWGREDLAAVAGSGAAAILVPKINSAADIDACQAALAAAPPALRLWVMIETCASITNLDSIATRAAFTRLSLFAMGINDLAKEMRARLTPARTPFLPLMSLAVVAARTHGVSILDGVCNEFRDMDIFRAEAEQGLLFGFDGKTLIHPDQIAPCNAIFSPSPDDVNWARHVIEAFALPENASKGVLRLDGKMVELLHLEEARRVIAITAQIGSSDISNQLAWDSMPTA